MRFAVTGFFQEWLLTNDVNPKRVAVVGGTSADPEVEILKSIHKDIEIWYLGIENSKQDVNFEYLDLNTGLGIFIQEFDLVICSQVLEHVWAIDIALDVLVDLTSTIGHLWINCPASNIPHGSPEYYSAGYSSDFLAKNLVRRGHDVLVAESFGSKRYYFMTHALRTWATLNESAHPIFRYNFKKGTIQGITKKFIMDLPGRIVASFIDGKIRKEITYATESVTVSKPKA